jgi:hypothetical protein
MMLVQLLCSTSNYSSVGNMITITEFFIVCIVTFICRIVFTLSVGCDGIGRPLLVRGFHWFHQHPSEGMSTFDGVISDKHRMHLKESIQSEMNIANNRISPKDATHDAFQESIKKRTSPKDAFLDTWERIKNKRISPKDAFRDAFQDTWEPITSPPDAVPVRIPLKDAFQDTWEPIMSHRTK